MMHIKNSCPGTLGITKFSVANTTFLFLSKNVRKKILNTLKNEPLSVLKPVADISYGQNVLLGISFFNIFRQKSFVISWRYLEKEGLSVLKPGVDIIYG